MLTDRQTELAIIGAIFFDAKSAFEQLEKTKLQPEHFADPELALLFDWARKEIAQGRAVDSITAGKAHVDSRETILESLSEHITTAHTAHYAADVRSMWIRREMIETAKRMMHEASTSADHPEVIRARMEAAISAMSGESGVKQVTVADAFDDQATLWEMAAKACGPVGIRTGSDVVDRYFGGLLKSGFYVCRVRRVVARPPRRVTLSRTWRIRGTRSACYR